MLGWASSLIGWAVSGVDDVWKKFVSVLKSIVSWTLGLYNTAISDINSVVQWVLVLIHAAEAFTSSVYTSVTAFAVTLYDDLVKWVQGLYASLITFGTNTIQWTTSWISRIYHDVTSWLTGLEAWILSNIWNPLYNFATGVARWIGTEGAWLVYVITHPDVLASILARYILAAWMQLGRRYARPFAQWMLHTMLSMASDFAGILEDFIAGLL